MFLHKEILLLCQNSTNGTTFQAGQKQNYSQLKRNEHILADELGAHAYEVDRTNKLEVEMD